MVDGWTDLEALRLTGSAWGLVAFLSLDEKGGEERNESDGCVEAVRSTCSAWGLITVSWLRESCCGREDSSLFLVSSGPGGATGREVSLLFSSNAREGSTFIDGGELVTR